MALDKIDGKKTIHEGTPKISIKVLFVRGFRLNYEILVYLKPYPCRTPELQWTPFGYMHSLIET